MKKGLTLFTKDGRVCGNAIVTGDAESHPDLGKIWPIETDFGNTARLIQSEINDQFYTCDKDGYERVQDIAKWREDRKLNRMETDALSLLSPPRLGDHPPNGE
jgi:hypothetical protein